MYSVSFTILHLIDEPYWHAAYMLTFGTNTNSYQLIKVP